MSAAEQTVYTYLLDDDLAPADVATRLGVSSRAATTLLRSLSEKGLVRRLAGRSPRFGVISPDAALPPLLRQREEELEVAREAARRVAQSYSSRVVPGQTASDDYVEIIFGTDALRTRFEMLQRDASSEICGCTKLPILMTPVGEEAPEEEGALERGVSVRALYEAAFLELPGGLDDIRESIRIGEKARVLPTLPSKLFIFDRTIALVHATELTPRGPELVGVVMRHPELVATLYELFDRMWEAATPIPTIGDIDRAVPGEVEEVGEEAIIQGLAAGMTDDSIARQFGLSRRTVARRVRALMERERARSRFQAGYRLGLQVGERKR
jgi:sugar-specific transcriptional regulator TrmB